MNSPPRGLCMVILPLALLAGCSDAGAGPQPTVSDRRVVSEHKMTADQMRQLTGVDRLPEVVDKAELRASIDRSYPEALRSEAVSGSALVDVLVDPRGSVESVTAISRPAGIRSALILEDKDGTQRKVTLNDHPAFQAAAQNAMKAVRFRPAIRDGLAVPYTLRMTIAFDPPSRSDP